MSNNIVRKLSTNINFILNDNINFKNNDIKFLKLFMLSCFTLGHGIYAFSTSKNENVTIVGKYKMVRNGFTDFMIIDNQGRHFNVSNSLWYWKWDSIEDWHNINDNISINIKYYGWRMPIFGLFPNVINSNCNKKDKIYFKNTISHNNIHLVF